MDSRSEFIEDFRRTPAEVPQSERGVVRCFHSGETPPKLTRPWAVHLYDLRARERTDELDAKKGSRARVGSTISTAKANRLQIALNSLECLTIARIPGISVLAYRIVVAMRRASQILASSRSKSLRSEAEERTREDCTARPGDHRNFSHFD